MTINYCDFLYGNDDTGNGTSGNPYKTIDKASTGLTGGDEVRVAKSPDPTALTGTISFTQNSTSITGTGTAFTTELTIGDFIKGGDDQWYEVVTISNDTAATLYQKYSGSTQSSVSSQKLGITSTGEASSSSTNVQSVNSSGTSSAELVISGGWDLSSQSKTGVTFFRQMHGTFSTRNGRGLYLSSKNYTRVENVGFLRYNYGIYYYSYSNNNTASSCTCNSNSGYGIYYSSSNNTTTSCTCNSNSSGIYYTSSNNNTATSCTCNSNSQYGIYYYSSSNNTTTSCTCNTNSYGIYYYSYSNNNTASSCTCNSNSGYGIYYSSSNNTTTSCTCNSNSYGIYYYYSNNNTATSCTCNSNSSYGIYSGLSNFNIIYNYQSSSVGISSARTYSSKPCLQFHNFNNTLGDHRCYYERGTSSRDTTNPRSGSGECLKFAPDDAIYYIAQSFFFAADSGTQKTLSAYLRKDSTFNGDVRAAIYFVGTKITDWTDITPTSSDIYEQKSIVAASTDITETGVLELIIQVRGTAGNIYVDDLSAA